MKIPAIPAIFVFLGLLPAAAQYCGGYLDSAAVDTLSPGVVERRFYNSAASVSGSLSYQALFTDTVSDGQMLQELVRRAGFNDVVLQVSVGGSRIDYALSDEGLSKCAVVGGQIICPDNGVESLPIFVGDSMTYIVTVDVLEDVLSNLGQDQLFLEETVHGTPYPQLDDRTILAFNSGALTLSSLDLFVCVNYRLNPSPLAEMMLPFPWSGKYYVKDSRIFQDGNPGVSVAWEDFMNEVGNRVVARSGRKGSVGMESLPAVFEKGHFIFLEAGSGTDVQGIHLYTITGQPAASPIRTPGGWKWDISGIPGGVYFLAFSEGKSLRSQKIILR